MSNAPIALANTDFLTRVTHYTDTKAVCPFCLENLNTDFLFKWSDDKSMVFLENNSQAYDKCHRTLVIESMECDVEYSSMTPSQLRDALQFIEECYHQLTEGKFSVMAFKNYGAMAGGSIPHTHMQLIRMEEPLGKVKLEVSKESGLIIEESDKYSITIPEHRTTEHIEINFSSKNGSWNLEMCESVVRVMRMFKLKYPDKYSYNIAYDIEGKALKLVFRYHGESAVGMFYGCYTRYKDSQLEKFINDVKS